MRKIVGFFVICCLFSPILHAQEITLDRQNLRKELSSSFTRARLAGQVSQQALQRSVTVELSSSLQTRDFKHFTETTPLWHRNFSAKPVAASSSFSQTGNRAPAGKALHPWQLAVFLGTESSERLSSVLGALKFQIRRSTLQQAVVLHHDSSLNLYVLYHNGRSIQTKRYQISPQLSSSALLEELFKSLAADSDGLYTGLIFSTHGSGVDLSVQEREISIPQLLEFLETNALHVDVLELDSCHMSSLYTAYRLAKNKKVDFLAASSDYEYATPQGTRVLPLVSFLHEDPRTAVTKAVNGRLKQFDFWGGGYATTGYSALDMKRLANALLKWYELYGFLRLSTDDEINASFDAFFKGEEWRSLNKIVRKQKEYVQTHFDELTSAYSGFDQLKQDFITSSDEFLQLSGQATLVQWCYSSARDRVYKQDIPDNDCLESISVDTYQFDTLWDEEQADVRSRWNTYVRKHLRRIGR